MGAWNAVNAAAVSTRGQRLAHPGHLAARDHQHRLHEGAALLAQGRLEEALEQWDRALAYAFPERKALEERARELRTRIAKKHAEAVQAKSEEPAEAPDPDPDLEEEDL